MMKVTHTVNRTISNIVASTFSFFSRMRLALLLSLSVMVAMGVEPFTIVVKTDNPGTSLANQFYLPVSGSSQANYNCTVNWGDGTSTTHIAESIAVHTYPSPGTYVVQITERVVGGFPHIFFNFGGDCLKLMQITRWGGGRWGSMENAFAGCSNLTIRDRK